MSGDVSDAYGDHQKLAHVDIAGDEVRRDLQKRLQVRASHVGIEAFGRSPVLVDEPNIGIVARLMKVTVETLTLAPSGDQGREGQAQRQGLARLGAEEG